MFSEGNLLYFFNFKFADGTPSKPKYFLILKKINGKTIVASLPTSQDYVPSLLKKKIHGCIEIKSHNFHCYYFAPNKMITDSSFAFKKGTYIYPEWVDEFNISSIENIYPYAGIDYELKGKLKSKELKEVIECIISSSSVKRKIRRKLSGQL